MTDTTSGFVCYIHKVC